LVILPEPPLLSQDPEEQALVADPRLAHAIALFNGGDWYACHDGLEELWHETSGRMRPLLQGILQIAVAELHHERGNLRGATILMGEGLGRLQGDLEGGLGLDLDSLRRQVGERLQALQQQRPLRGLDLPYLAVKIQA
jgi:uncharacterized protein